MILASEWTLCVIKIAQVMCHFWVPSLDLSFFPATTIFFIHFKEIMAQSSREIGKSQSKWRNITDGVFSPPSLWLSIGGSAPYCCKWSCWCYIHGCKWPSYHLPFLWPWQGHWMPWTLGARTKPPWSHRGSEHPPLRSELRPPPSLAKPIIRQSGGALHLAEGHFVGQSAKFGSWVATGQLSPSPRPQVPLCSTWPNIFFIGAYWAHQSILRALLDHPLRGTIANDKRSTRATNCHTPNQRQAFAELV